MYKVLEKRKLDLILLLDNSNSMKNGRMTQVNHLVPMLKDRFVQLGKDGDADIKLRVIPFNDTPEWKIGTVTEGADIESVVWKDLGVEDGMPFTDLAIAEANKVLKLQSMGKRTLPPVVILITSGNCNPNRYDKYLSSIEEMKKLSGKNGEEKMLRIAIGVKADNQDELETFASIGQYTIRQFVFSIYGNLSDVYSSVNAIGNTISESIEIYMDSPLYEEELFDFDPLKWSDIPDWNDDDE